MISVTEGESAHRRVDDRVDPPLVERRMADEQPVQQRPEHQIERGVQVDVGAQLATGSQPGVFAAGDVRSGSVKRVASAVGEGSMAIRQIHEYFGT